jgi:hypothetical protein
MQKYPTTTILIFLLGITKIFSQDTAHYGFLLLDKRQTRYWLSFFNNTSQPKPMIQEIDKIISGFREIDENGIDEKRFKHFMETSGIVRHPFLGKLLRMQQLNLNEGLKSKIKEDIDNLLLLKHLLQTDKQLHEKQRATLLYYLLIYNCLDSKLKDIWFIEPLYKDNGQYYRYFDSKNTSSHCLLLLKSFESFTSSTKNCFETENHFVILFKWVSFRSID